MSRAVLFLLAALAGARAWAAPASAVSTPPPIATPSVAARAYALLDFQSNQFLAAQQADERMEPASLTKLMTAYLAFTAIRQKKLALDQPVPVSERAWKAPGSRMFIEPNKPVTVEQLLRGMIIQSGNDACIALAEAIAGSEELFAQLMNKEAQRLGLRSTHFVNATGLPHPRHYSSARDMALLAAAIIREFPDFYPLYSQKEYSYNNITQANRNRLLWTDPFVDGMKTGHTENAGHCLVSSARRGERRLISVVLGAASDAARAAESQKLLNYGFQFFDTQRLYKQGQEVATLSLFKGERDVLKAGFDQDLYLTLPRDQFARLKANLVTTQPLLAPIARGQRVGTMLLTLDGAKIAEYPVLSLETVGVAGFFGRAWDSLKLMWK